MEHKNMHYCYNVEYFQDTLLENKDDADKAYGRHNSFIYKFELWDGSYLQGILEEKENLEGLRTFTLETVYPGLFIGSGYLHEGKNPLAGNVKNVILGGFFFDYVTGLPVIPGSTLKGMLRSYFQEGEKWELIKELAGKTKADLSNVGMGELVKNLFEGKDVFIGGFPVIEEKVPLLDSEYITPHKDLFKNPIPLSLLKIRPGVTFEFVFLLHDYADGQGTALLSAGQKERLYKSLLELGGIGAKTNVGFGQFRQVRSKAAIRHS